MFVENPCPLLLLGLAVPCSWPSDGQWLCFYLCGIITGGLGWRTPPKRVEFAVLQAWYRAATEGLWMRDGNTGHKPVTSPPQSHSLSQEGKTARSISHWSQMSRQWGEGPPSWSVSGQEGFLSALGLGSFWNEKWVRFPVLALEDVEITKFKPGWTFHRNYFSPWFLLNEGRKKKKPNRQFALSSAALWTPPLVDTTLGVLKDAIGLEWKSDTFRKFKVPESDFVLFLTLIISVVSITTTDTAFSPPVVWMF